MHEFNIYEQQRTYNPGQNLETIHKTHIFNLNVGKQRVKTFSLTPPPPYKLLLDSAIFSVAFNIVWRGGGGTTMREMK